MDNNLNFLQKKENNALEIFWYCQKPLLPNFLNFSSMLAKKIYWTPPPPPPPPPQSAKKTQSTRKQKDISNDST